MTMSFLIIKEASPYRKKQNQKLTSFPVYFVQVNLPSTLCIPLEISANSVPFQSPFFDSALIYLLLLYKIKDITYLFYLDRG